MNSMNLTVAGSHFTPEIKSKSCTLQWKMLQTVASFSWHPPAQHLKNVTAQFPRCLHLFVMWDNDSGRTRATISGHRLVGPDSE